MNANRPLWRRLHYKVRRRFWAMWSCPSTDPNDGLLIPCERHRWHRGPHRVAIDWLEWET